jgi:hypothetical protein
MSLSRAANEEADFIRRTFKMCIQEWDYSSTVCKHKKECCRQNELDLDGRELCVECFEETNAFGEMNFTDGNRAR